MQVWKYECILLSRRGRPIQKIIYVREAHVCVVTYSQFKIIIIRIRIILVFLTISIFIIYLEDVMQRIRI